MLDWQFVMSFIFPPVIVSLFLPLLALLISRTRFWLLPATQRRLEGELCVSTRAWPEKGGPFLLARSRAGFIDAKSENSPRVMP